MSERTPKDLEKDELSEVEVTPEVVSDEDMQQVLALPPSTTPGKSSDAAGERPAIAPIPKDIGVPVPGKPGQRMLIIGADGKVGLPKGAPLPPGIPEEMRAQLEQSVPLAQLERPTPLELPPPAQPEPIMVVDNNRPPVLRLGPKHMVKKSPPIARPVQPEAFQPAVPTPAVPQRVRKLLLKQTQSPGDILTFSNAVGDLKRTYPHWLIDVRSPAHEIWDNNIHLTPLDEKDPEVETYDIGYSEINISGWSGLHYSEAFRHDLNEKLNSNPKMVALYGTAKIQQTGIRPELYISDEEKSWYNQVHCECFWDGPFWVINAGRKPDNVLKQYHRWQEVVEILNEYFAGRVKIVQMGHPDHIHPPLQNTFNLIGKTNTRELIRLLYL